MPIRLATESPYLRNSSDLILLQTLSTVQSFVLAMASFPEVQEKAKAELDSVVGPHRLPEFSDRDSLPYINALIKELLRWRSVVPVGVPHRTLDDDEYRGYFIPKGSIVVANIWCVCAHILPNVSISKSNDEPAFPAGLSRETRTSTQIRRPSYPSGG